MEKIESFKVNHLKLRSGLYVSRKDSCGGETVTTFDMRVTEPNREPVMDMAALHTVEHLGATYLRNCAIKDRILYFGPMGCRTGCYVLVSGDMTPEEFLPTVLDMCDFMVSYDGEIPGARPEECGNWLEQNLPMAKYYMTEYRRRLTESPCFTYPD